MYSRELQAENCVIVGSFLYSQRYAGQRSDGNPVSLEWLSNDSKMESSGYKKEEGKERLRLWHVESDEKDKKQVTRFLESIYNMNQRKLFTLGY
jgi:hypothetical protein